MKNLISLIKTLLNAAVKYKSLIPKGFVVIFTLISAVGAGFSQGWREGIEVLVKTVLTSELIIRNNVELAIAADPTYSAFAFFQIINAVFILYILTRIIAKGVLVGMTGSQAPIMSYLVAIGFLGIIEMGVIGWTEGIFFIPLWDGVIFMLLNMPSVWQNINWLSMSMPNTPAIETILGVTENSTVTISDVANNNTTR